MWIKMAEERRTYMWLKMAEERRTNMWIKMAGGLTYGSRWQED